MNKFYNFDFNLEEEITERCLVDDWFYLNEVKQRKLFICSEIEQCTISDAVRHIIQYNMEDKGKDIEERKPIILYVISNGGNVDDGFELIDMIINSKTPVYTVNLGYQYSMGFLIGLAGHKRFAMEHAKFLMHDGSNFSWGSSAKVQDRMKFQERAELRIKEYILSRTKITNEEYDKNFRVEWYMFADEAKEKGCCDYIIGSDCELDDVL
jgi:ATP-dependent Clp protease protease subunit